MFTYLYEILGGIIFMFYLHLLGFGKERFSSISKKTIYQNTLKYQFHLVFIFILVIFLIFSENKVND